jgi:hypothetical protein
MARVSGTLEVIETLLRTRGHVLLILLANRQGSGKYVVVGRGSHISIDCSRFRWL